MTEEEYFRTNYPDYCYGDKPLSPCWDFFQDGVEFGERQSEKKIADLEKQNEELQDKLANADYQLEGRDLEVMELQEENLKLEAKVKALEIEQHYCMPNCSKVTELEKQIEKMKSDSKAAYIKGIRTMANALKEYDKTEGSWTDYFEHTVDKVLKNLLKE